MWFSAGSEASSVSKVFPEGRILSLLGNNSIPKNSGTASPGYRNNATLQLGTTSSLDDWSVSGIPTGAVWKIGGFGNSRFVAIGSIFSEYEEEPLYGDRVDISIYSDDGIKWNIGPVIGAQRVWNWFAGTSSPSNGIMYGNGKFIALSSSGILHSTDGVNWQSSAAVHPSNQTPIYMAFGNGIFVYKTAQQNHTYYTSTDGISWTTRSFPSFSGVLLNSISGYVDIAFNGGIFMTSTGFKSETWDMSILKSEDGINWTRVPSPPIPADLTSFGVNSIIIDDAGKYAFLGGYRLIILQNIWQLSNRQHYATNYSGYFKNKFFSISGKNVSTSSDGLTWTRFLDALPIQAEGPIIDNGSYYKLPFAVGRIDPSVNYRLDGSVLSLAVQPDQKILVGGNFNFFTQHQVNRIARLLPDGSLDLDFKNNTGSGVNSNLETIVVQPDGKIILGGGFETFNGVTVNGIVRLNSDGTRDTAFTSNTGTGFSSLVKTISLQPDGKIIVGGLFTSFNGAAAPYAVRLNSNGTRDNTFSIGSGTNGWVYASAVQADGKIILGGGFTTFNGVTSRNTVRLNSDGTRDVGFSGGPTTATVYSIVIDPNGKILVGGRFSYLQPGLGKGILRRNTDGSYDESFNPIGYNADDIVYDIAVQANGKILVVGNFNMFNGVTSKGIACLNSDGSTDQEFLSNIGSGAESISNFSGQPVVVTGQIYSVAVQENKKIAIGGQFETFNSFSSRNIARLHGGPTA
jgi:uncharacterized delta-60 repeat protein